MVFLFNKACPLRERTEDKPDAIFVGVKFAYIIKVHIYRCLFVPKYWREFVSDTTFAFMSETALMSVNTDHRFFQP